MPSSPPRRWVEAQQAGAHSEGRVGLAVPSQVSAPSMSILIYASCSYRPLKASVTVVIKYHYQALIQP